MGYFNIGGGTGGKVTSVNGQVGDVQIDTFSGEYNDLSNKPNIPSVPTDIGTVSQDDFTAHQAEIIQLKDKVDPFNADISDADAKNAFIETMNKKAEYIGMLDTNFANAHGLGNPSQVTTTKDMLLLGLRATAYGELVKAWSRKEYAFKIEGPQERDVSLGTTVTSPYFEDYYHNFGGKTGSLIGVTSNLLITGNAPNNNWFISSSLGTSGERFKTAKSLFDIATQSVKENQPFKYADILISNGNFHEGLSMWTISGGDPEVVETFLGNYLSVNAGGSSEFVRKPFNVTAGNLYYITAKVKCTRHESGILGLQTTISDEVINIGVSEVTEDFVLVSAIIEAKKSGVLNAGALVSPNLEGLITDVKLMNLTKDYGAGNEPTQEYLDKHTWVDIDADMGAVCLVPVQSALAYNQNNLPIIYEKNWEQSGVPASLTKVMTAMIMLDTVVDLNKRIELISSDITSGSGPAFYAGDVLTLRDALHCLMLPSSNTIAEAIARTVGKKILIDTQYGS